MTIQELLQKHSLDFIRKEVDEYCKEKRVEYVKIDSEEFLKHCSGRLRAYKEKYKGYSGTL